MSSLKNNWIDKKVDALKKWEGLPARSFDQIYPTLQQLIHHSKINFISFSQRKKLLSWIEHRVEQKDCEDVHWNEVLSQLKYRLQMNFFPGAGWDAHEHNSSLKIHSDYIKDSYGQPGKFSRFTMGNSSDCNGASIALDAVSGAETDDEQLDLNPGNEGGEIGGLPIVRENIPVGRDFDSKFLVLPTLKSVRTCTIVQRARNKLRCTYRMSLQDQIYVDESQNQITGLSRQFSVVDAPATDGQCLPSPLTKRPSLLNLRIGSQKETMTDGSRFLLSTKRSRSGKPFTINHIWGASGLWKNKLAMGQVMVNSVTADGRISGGSTVHISHLLGSSQCKDPDEGNSFAIMVESEGDSRLLRLTAIIPQENTHQCVDDGELTNLLNEAVVSGVPPKGYMLLRNKKPRWSAWQGSHTLCFDRGSDRVKEPSRKNISVVLVQERLSESDNVSKKTSFAGTWDADDQDEEALRLSPVVLQVGKLAEDYFSLDFGYPLSPFQAFVIAMCAFDG